MTKYRYNKISNMRTFSESPAKWFMVDGVKVTRKDLERSAYVDIKNMIKCGKIRAVQRIG